MSYLSEVFLLNGKFTGPGKPVSLVKSPSYPGSQLSSQTWLLQTTKYGHLRFQCMFIETLRFCVLGFEINKQLQGIVTKTDLKT